MKSLDRPPAGRTVLEFLIRHLGTIEVFARMSDSPSGQSAELRLTTPTSSWSWSSSGMPERRA